MELCIRYQLQNTPIFDQLALGALEKSCLAYSSVKYKNVSKSQYVISVEFESKFVPLQQLIIFEASDNVHRNVGLDKEGLR